MDVFLLLIRLRNLTKKGGFDILNTKIECKESAVRILSVTAQKVDSTGSGVYLTELVKGFDKAGHDQAVICGTVWGDVINLPENVTVYPVFYQSEELPFPICGMSDEMPYESTRYCDLTDEMTDQLFAAFRCRVRDAVEEFKPDVILCHHLYFLAALVRMEYPEIPVYGQCHGSDLRQFKKNHWQHALIYSQISRLNGIFALHQEQKQMICEIYGVPEKMVTVIGTGYNSDVFRIHQEIKAVEREKIRLIFVGKISEKKGVLSLLRAMQYLQWPDQYELYLAGGYGNEAEFEKIRQLALVAPCYVEFLGRLDHNTLARELNKSDIFILPSFYEGLPLVLIEAMACGLHAICTDLPGIKPWLNNAIPRNGVQFVRPPEMRNEDEPIPESLPDFEKRLAAAIQTVLWNPEADQKRVRSVSWDALCSRICSIWDFNS